MEAPSSASPRSSSSGFNYHAFNHINSVLPFLEYHDVQLATAAERGGQLRVYASSQHPIAMGAAFALLLPLAVYCVRTWGRRWWLATALIIFGAVATQSRSAVVMLFVIAIVYVGLHPRETARLWPLVLPALVIIHFAVPGNLGSIKDSFFPEGGLVAEQADKPVGSGRLATLGPVLRDEFLPNPIVGEGFATRITVSEPGLTKNAPITDDEWLDLLAETGIVGALALLWVFVRSVRRMWLPAKHDPSARGWLLAATTASVRRLWRSACSRMTRSPSFRSRSCSSPSSVSGRSHFSRRRVTGSSLLGIAPVPIARVKGVRRIERSPVRRPRAGEQPTAPEAGSWRAARLTRPGPIGASRPELI